MSSPTRFWLLVTVGLALYVFLSVGHALTRRPWMDEGLMAAPAANLATNGTLANKVWESAGADQPGGNGQTKGVDEHAYYVMPLYLLAQGLWFKLLTPNLFIMRLFSTICGVLLLAAVYFLVRSLTGSSWSALVCGVLLALDYTFLVGSSFGREDMMSAALGFWALAAYMLLRARSLSTAVVASSALATAAVFTHPVAVAHFLGLAVLVLHFDRQRLRVRLFAYAALPVMLALLLFGLYVRQSPGDFLAQFGANASTGDRLLALRAPWKSLWLEVTNRYLAGFGLGPHSAGHFGPIFLKSLVLIAYLTAILASLLVRRLRRRPGVKIILGLTVIYMLVLAFIDSTKQFDYILHVIPLFAILLGLLVAWCWTERIIPRACLVAGVLGMLALQVGGIVYKIKLNTYRNSYLEAVRFLKEHAGDRAYIIGSSDLGFDLGFSGQRFRDDSRLGYFSGRKADFIVVEESYQVAFEGHRLHRPAVDQYVRKLLAGDYIVVYDRNHYKIYRQRKYAGNS